MLTRVAAAVLVAASVVWSGGQAVGAQAPGAVPQPPVGRGGMGTMMAGRQTMQAEMEAQAKKLDALVAAMNASSGTEKIDRVAALVNELVAQHKAMHARMAAMPMMSAPAAPATPPAAAGDEHAGHHPTDR